MKEKLEKEVEVTIRGKKYLISHDKVERSLEHVGPQRISKYSISLNSKLFPIKQVIAASLEISPMEFGTSVAYQILQDLGFKIIKKS